MSRKTLGGFWLWCMLLPGCDLPTAVESMVLRNDDSVCRRDEVVQVVQNHHQRQDYYFLLDSGKIRQFRTDAGNIFYCAYQETKILRKHGNSYGEVFIKNYGYHVQVFGNRFEVYFDDF